MEGKKSLKVLVEFRFSCTSNGVLSAAVKPLFVTAIKNQANQERLAKEALKHAEFNKHIVEDFDRKKLALMQKWECTKIGCLNINNHCWPRHIDNMHMKVEEPHFVAWEKAIEDGRGMAFI